MIIITIIIITIITIITITTIRRRKRTIFVEHLPMANCVTITKEPCTYEALIVSLLLKNPVLMRG